MKAVVGRKEKGSSCVEWIMPAGVVGLLSRG